MQGWHDIILITENSSYTKEDCIMKYNEEAFEGTIDIVAAAMEEAEVELTAEGGKKVAEFFEAIYQRLAVIAQDGEDDEDDDDDEEDDDEEDEDSEEDEEASEEAKPASRTGSFEVYMDANGKYRFRMKAANGQTIAVSQAYKKKESCLKGIESVRKNAEAVVKEV